MSKVIRVRFGVAYYTVCSTLAPLSQTIRSQTKTDCDLLACVFPHLTPLMYMYVLWILIGSLGCLHWLVRVILVLLLQITNWKFCNDVPSTCLLGIHPCVLCALARIPVEVPQTTQSRTVCLAAETSQHWFFKQGKFIYLESINPLRNEASIIQTPAHLQ